MLIYLLVILLIFFMQYRLNAVAFEKERSKIETRYLMIVCWILVLLAAFRGSSVGTDTAHYLAEYFEMPDMTVEEILEKFSDYPGYFILAKACSFLHLPIQALFGLVEGLYVYAIYKFLNRFSKDKMFSILGFTVIGLFSFSMAGLKQTLSMAFALLYYMDMCDKKYIRALVFAIIAYFCHHVSLIFLAGVALFFMRNLKFFYVYLALIVAIILLGTSKLWSEMLSMLENDHYSELYQADEGYSSTSMIIYGVLLSLLFVFSGRYSRLMQEDSRIMLGMSTLAFAFQAFSFVSSAAFRLSFFFLHYMVVAFPNEISCIGDTRMRRSMSFIVELLLIFVFIYTNRHGGSVVPYKFFWQT